MVVRTNLLIVQHDPNNPGYQDGGDSSRATGIMATFGNEVDTLIIGRHWTKDGFVRNPYQKEWNDPKNFSRDQLLCLVSGLYYSGKSDIVRYEFFKRRYWYGVCPNGDVLGPEFYLHMILCGKIYPLYILYPFLIIFQIFHVYWATKLVPRNEQNQTICVAKRSGLLNLWMKWHPHWKESLYTYWGGWRDQKEIADFLIFRCTVSKDLSS